MRLSVIIPSHKEPLLQKTIDSLLENAEGEIEIIAVLDGYLPEIPLKEDSRVKILHLEKNLGMRGAINAGLNMAKSDFIMKCDAHCAFGPGFDRIMSENCAENWLLIPRQYPLNEKNFDRDESRPRRDYYFFTFPGQNFGYVMPIQSWYKRTCKRKDPKYDIDDIMTFQGSCWFANKKYFMEHVGFLDDQAETYGPFKGEQLEIGLKYWLGGGENKIIKKTWYAHLRKRKKHYSEGLYKRHYKRNSRIIKNRIWTAQHWMNNEEPNMIHPLSWLIEKFWPIPTWESNWKEIWESQKLLKMAN